MSEPATPHAPTRQREPGRRLWFAGVGIGAAALLGGAWAARIPLAELILRAQLAAPGQPAQLDLTRLDFSGATITDLRTGPRAAPDLTARRIKVDFAWRGVSPHIQAIAVEGATLRARVSENGVRLGVLDRFGTGATKGAGKLPDWAIDGRDLRVIVESPFGAATLQGWARGALNRDFAARFTLPAADLSGAQGGAENLRGELNAVTRAGQLTARAAMAADTLRWRGNSAVAMRGVVLGLDASTPVAALDWRASGRAAIDAAQGERFAARAGALAFTARISGQAAAANYAFTLAEGALGGFTLREARLAGPASAQFAAGKASVSAQGDLTAAAMLDADARRAFLRRIPALAGTPLAPLVAQSKPTLDRALGKFTIAAPLDFFWAKGQGRLSVHGAAAAQAANGARLTLAPLGGRGAGAPLGVVIPRGLAAGAARMTLHGPGLPSATLDLEHFAATPLRAAGRLGVAEWRGGGAALRAAPVRFDLLADGKNGSLTLDGAATITGPLIGLRLVDANTPLQLAIRWGGGFRAEPSGGACPEIQAARIEAFGLWFDKARLTPCPAGGGAFAAADANGELSGGFTLDAAALKGRMAGAARPASLGVARLDARLTGKSARPKVNAQIKGLTLTLAFDKQRAVSVRGDRIDARYESLQQGWTAAGALANFSAADSSVSPRLERLNSAWTAGPGRNGAVLRLNGGTARVFDPAARPLVQPIRLQKITGQLADGAFRGEGAMVLEDGGATLGAFTLTHALGSGAGEAHATARQLMFSPTLQPEQISELMRGVVGIVRGPVDADIAARWTKSDFRTGATITFNTISLATVALGPIEGLAGTITFDDFIRLTTPPGQSVRAALINPGVPVRDGVIGFQLLADQRVRIESARWPFLKGALTIEPTVLELNGAENRMTLALAELDVAELTKQLNVKGLSATGSVSGRMPLVFTKEGGRIENGRLQSAPGGGTIQYASDLQQTGAARLAFDALRSFRYEALALDIGGPLDGELVTQIAFSGRNREPAASGLGSPVKLVGIPFKFNVQVTAPFVALGRAAAGFSDPGKLLEQTRASVTAEPAPPAPQK